MLCQFPSLAMLSKLKANGTKPCAAEKAPVMLSPWRTVKGVTMLPLVISLHAVPGARFRNQIDTVQATLSDTPCVPMLPRDRLLSRPSDEPAKALF